MCPAVQGACIGKLLLDIEPQRPPAEIQTDGRSLECRIARDVTDRVETEAALRESENRYRVVREADGRVGGRGVRRVPGRDRTEDR